MSSVDGARSMLGGSEETFDNACDPCSFLGLQKEGTTFCINCQEKLCKSCTAAHKGQKITRNHDLVPVSKLQNNMLPNQGASSTVLCDCSQNAGVAIFCQDHDDVICQSCAVIKHRACKTVAIGDKIASYQNEQFADVEQKADKLNDDTDKILNERKSELESYSTMTEKAKGDLQKFRQDINRQIDQIEQAMSTELRDRESRHRQEVDDHISSCTTTKQLIETDLKMLHDVKQSADTADMYAADVKVSKRLAEYDRLLKEIQRGTSSPSLTFRKNDQLWELLINIKNIGTVVEHRIEKEQNKNMLFTELKVKGKMQELVKMSSDRMTPSITGCVFMPVDRLVLCDYQNSKLKLLDKSFKLQDSLDLPSCPFDISVVNDTTVIITLPDKKQLQYIEVAPRLKIGRVLQIDKKCYGVQVVDSDIYVTCHSGYRGGDGEVRILDNNGNLKKRLGVNQDKTFMFELPCYLAVSIKSNKIYVSDAGQDTVTCLKLDGTVIFQYKDPKLSTPRGLCVDDEDNVIVCGRDSHNIHVVTTAAGKKSSDILTNKDGIRKPYSVTYRQTDHTLIVGCYDNDNLIVYMGVQKLNAYKYLSRDMRLLQKDNCTK